jgi:hypothetical protein
MSGPRIPADVADALDATGFPWSIETGSKHYHVRLSGYLVGVLPKGNTKDRHQRSTKNLISNIRNATTKLRLDNVQQKG